MTKGPSPSFPTGLALRGGCGSSEAAMPVVVVSLERLNVRVWAPEFAPRVPLACCCTSSCFDEEEGRWPWMSLQAGESFAALRGKKRLFVLLAKHRSPPAGEALPLFPF
jgi:hypothetical protein